MEVRFYFSLAEKALNSDIVKWNGKTFDRFGVKCGEAIKQTVSKRHKQQGTQLSKFHDFLNFVVDLDQLKKAYPGCGSKNTHFDEDIFGFQKLPICFADTVFSYFECWQIKPISKDVGAGKEYIDIAADINLWLSRNKDEVDRINSDPCIENFIDVVQDYFNLVVVNYVDNFLKCKFNSNIEKGKFKFRDYQQKFYNIVVELINAGENNFNCEQPPRWGKTKFMLKLFSDSSCKVMVIISYVKTVNKSYRGEINATDFGRGDLQFIEIDDLGSGDFSKIIDHSKRQVIAINTTGSISKWKSRVNRLEKLLNILGVSAADIFYVNEEADFGNHTDLSVEKINMLRLTSISPVFSITGTDAAKADNVFPNAQHIVVNIADFNEIYVAGKNKSYVM